MALLDTTASFRYSVASPGAVCNVDFGSAYCEHFRRDGDVDTGKAILRDYIKATVGFEKLGTDIGSSGNSLTRMFCPTGNP